MPNACHMWPEACLCTVRCSVMLAQCYQWIRNYQCKRKTTRYQWDLTYSLQKLQWIIFLLLTSWLRLWAKPKMSHYHKTGNDPIDHPQDTTDEIYACPSHYSETGQQADHPRPNSDYVETSAGPIRWIDLSYLVPNHCPKYIFILQILSLSKWSNIQAI